MVLALGVASAVRDSINRITVTPPFQKEYPMFLYEVNLYVQKEHAASFLAWLDLHIKEMLSFDGFISAELWNREPDETLSDPKADLLWLSVHYRLDHRHNFELYLEQHAERMREEGLRHFKGRFSADRRCYLQKKVYTI